MQVAAMMRLFLGLLIFYGLTAAAQPADISDLAYSVQGSDTLYMMGKVQTKTVQLERKGQIGKGRWTVYSGTANNRVRLKLDDRKGLQEILALDSGQRMTISQIGVERTEYRLFAPDRKFIVGSVIYREKNKWLQGIMLKEKFEGYPALADVTDVSKKFQAQLENPAVKVADWLKRSWDGVTFIPVAHAQSSENSAAQIRRLFSIGNDFIHGPVAREIMKAQLVGAAAFAVKLVEVNGGMSVVLELVGGGAAAATALPMLQAALVGIAAAEVAIRAYDAAEKYYERVLKAKDLGNSTSIRDFFDRLRKPSSYEPAEEETTAEKPQVSVPSSPRPYYQRPADKLKSLVQMSAQMDATDFRQELTEADDCTMRRDFKCTEEHLLKASRIWGQSSDLQLIEDARNRMVKQKELIATEARLAKEQAAQASRPPPSPVRAQVASRPPAAQSAGACPENDPALIGTWENTAANGARQTWTFDGCFMTLHTSNNASVNCGDADDSQKNSYVAKGGLLRTREISQPRATCPVAANWDARYRISGATLTVSDAVTFRKK